jgi:CDP-diglyceride synthetase
MLKAIFGFVVGYAIGKRSGERRAIEAASPRSGASGFLGALIILIAILAIFHVDLRSHPDRSPRVERHATFSR